MKFLEKKTQQTTSKLLLLSLLLSLSLASGFTLRSRSKVSSELASQLALLAKNGTNASANGTAAPATPGTNVVGSDKPTARVASPFTVSKCDQIVQVDAKTLDDLNNFQAQSAKFFTLSMYSVVQFGSKAPTAFESLIAIGAIQKVPYILTGSVSCVKFESYTRNIIVCLKDAQEANFLLDAYKAFMKCRMGDNLTKIAEPPKAKMQNILNKACMGLEIAFDDAKYPNPVDAEAALNIAIDGTLRKLAENKDSFFLALNGTNTAPVGGFKQSVK